MANSQTEEDITLESPPLDVFMPPSIHHTPLHLGDSYTHYSPIPSSLLPNTTDPTQCPPCVLGVDEAGRGPVLGPMVYGLFYLSITSSTPLLKETHHFDDSKVLTPTVRSSLMEKLCTPSTDLHSSCGWAVEVMSARNISANMLKPGATYNLNAQAMDATIALIEGVFRRGVNVKEIYVDTIGMPAVYQKRLEWVFPTAKVVVAKKADSLYPSVSAASVCAKVTRDACLEVLYENYTFQDDAKEVEGVKFNAKVVKEQSWGSGYPSDGKCTAWMRRNMDPVFGWGSECRFSWGTAKDMLEVKGEAVKVEWPVVNDDEGTTHRVTDFFSAEREDDVDELGSWFGRPVGVDFF